MAKSTTIQIAVRPTSDGRVSEIGLAVGKEAYLLRPDVAREVGRTLTEQSKGLKPSSLRRHMRDRSEHPFVATRRNGSAPIVISELTLRQTDSGDIDLLIDDAEYHYRLGVQTVEDLIEALKKMVRTARAQQSS